MKKRVFFLVFLAAVGLSFYYGLFLGIHFGLVSTVNTEIGNLQELNAIIKILENKPTDSERKEAIRKYNDTILAYLVQKRKTVEDMTYLDVVLSPVESLRLVCKDWYPKKVKLESESNN